MADMTFLTTAPSGNPGRVKVGQLISDSWRTLMDARRQLLLPWVALTVILLLMRVGGQYLGIDPARLLQSVSGLVITGATSVATGVIMAGVVRTLLGRREDAWSMDSGAVGFIALNVAMTTVFGCIVFAMAPPADQTDPAVMMAYGMRVLGMFGLMIAFAVAALGLTLFPLGVLMRNSEITLGRAWSLMRGAKLSYMLAAAVLGVGPGVLAGVFAGIGRLAGAAGLPFTALSVACTGLTTLSSAAVVAQLYRLRAGPNPYAEVFD